MKRVNLADAKAHLRELVDRAAAGEAVCITRRGKALAQITAVDTRRKRIDSAALRAMTDAMPMQPQTARDLIRRMRDDDRSNPARERRRVDAALLEMEEDPLSGDIMMLPPRGCRASQSLDFV